MPPAARATGTARQQKMEETKKAKEANDAAKAKLLATLWSGKVAREEKVRESRGATSRKVISIGATYIDQLKEYKESFYESLSPEQKYTLDSSIEYVEAKEDPTSTYNVHITAKVRLLKNLKAQKKCYLETIFDFFLTDPTKKQLVDDHLKSLDAWRKSTNTSRATLQDIEDYYYANCKHLQTNIIDQIRLLDADCGIDFANKYKQLTTPIYFDIRELYPTIDPAVIETSTKLKICSIFYQNAIKNKEAIFYVFSQDLDVILNINTGIWRQLYSDGHALMKSIGNGKFKTIESNGKHNAAHPLVVPAVFHALNPVFIIDSTEMPQYPEDTVRCPGCLTPTGSLVNNGNGERTFVKKPGVSTAVDHISPVKQAFITLKDNGLCSQLAITCARCNGTKKDMREEEFIHFIINSRNPLHTPNEVGGLSPLQTNMRIRFYVNNIKVAIAKGIYPFAERLERASIMQDTYDALNKLKEAQFHQILNMTELIETAPALLALQVPQNAGFLDNFLDNILEILLFTLIDKRRGYLYQLENVTDHDINVIVGYFINTLPLPAGHNITLDNLEELLKTATTSALAFDFPQLEGPQVWIDSLPSYLYKYIDDLNPDIKYQNFVEICKFFYRRRINIILDKKLYIESEKLKDKISDPNERLAISVLQTIGKYHLRRAARKTKKKKLMKNSKKKKKTKNLKKKKRMKNKTKKYKRRR